MHLLTIYILFSDMETSNPRHRGWQRHSCCKPTQTGLSHQYAAALPLVLAALSWSPAQGYVPLCGTAMICLLRCEILPSEKMRCGGWRSVPPVMSDKTTSWRRAIIPMKLKFIVTRMSKRMLQIPRLKRVPRRSLPPCLCLCE
jgi:hypothetical protein